LIGKNYTMVGDYKKAIEALEQAASLEPTNAEFADWLGQAYGRRAETGSPFTAPALAVKARKMFEKSVFLCPSYKQALNHLLDYYLSAPEVLGGGLQKAEELAVRIGRTDPADGHDAQAQVEEKRKAFDAAERHLRLASELAPGEPRHSMNLAVFLAKRGRFGESEALFNQAAALAPARSGFLFERATVYIDQRRNLDVAARLLQRYISAPLTADDPSREDAKALLKKIKAIVPDTSNWGVPSL
jgi:Flp pilus assembly protein TadD